MGFLVGSKLVVEGQAYEDNRAHMMIVQKGLKAFIRFAVTNQKLLVKEQGARR